MKKHILFISAVVFWNVLVNAGPPFDDPARPTLGQTGQLFVIKFEPGSKRFSVALAGEPVAIIGPNRIIVRGRQVPANGQPKSLDIEPANGFFQILDSVDPHSSIEIEIKDRSNQKSETFKVEMKKRP
jgi:hypothetical protein